MIPQVAPSQRGNVRVNPKQLTAFIKSYDSIVTQFRTESQWPRLTIDALIELGEDHILELKLRIEQKLQIKFDISIDAATNSVTFRPLMPEEIVEEEQGCVSASSSSTTTSKGKAGKIPRPANAFILYRQHWHPTIKAENPGLHNNDISVILGNKWRTEDEHVKAEFRAKADEAKRQHAIDHPEYHYQPRKPSEKKRRMTKNKLAKLAAASPDDKPIVEQRDLPEFDPSSLFGAAISIIPSPEFPAGFEVTNFYEQYHAPIDSLAIGRTGEAIGFHACPVSDDAIAQAIQDFNATVGSNARFQHSAATLSTASVVDGASFDHHPKAKNLPITGADNNGPVVDHTHAPSGVPDISIPETIPAIRSNTAEVIRQEMLEEFMANDDSFFAEFLVNYEGQA